MTKSISTLNNLSYNIPEILDDKEGIEDFLSNNLGKKIIVVQGLGFVGAVMALVCSNSLNEEYAVIGVDLPNKESYWKIKSINDGVFPLIAEDPKIDIFFNNAKEKGNLYATYDPIAYSYADIIIVDINLDVQKQSKKDHSIDEFNVNLSGFKSAISSIGKNCKENVLLLVETTVPPGTCAKVVKPIIDKELLNRNLSNKDYSLGHSYERVMPGPEYINSIREFPRVYSGIDENSANKIEIFLKTIIDTEKCSLTRLAHTNATEMAKVLENSYRAMNIAFAVEWSRFAEEADVDLYAIVNAIRVRKTHSNLMYPGIGVGGYCLTKDPLLASWSKENFFNSNDALDMSIDSVSINDQMPVFAFNRFTQVFGSIENKKVAFLGVSYRGDVGDTRFSPVKPFFDLVKNAGGIITLHDPYVSFWSEADIKVESSLEKALSINPDNIIISTGHTQYKSEETIKNLMNLMPSNIYDTIGLFSESQIKVLKSKHNISILGRGNNS